MSSVKVARARIEDRLGRQIGPVSTMPKHLRRALLLLAREIARSREARK